MMEDTIDILVIDKDGATKFSYKINKFQVRPCEDSDGYFAINGYYMIGVDTDKHFFDIEPYDHIVFRSGGYSHVGIVSFKDYLDDKHRYVKVKSIFCA